MAFLHPEVRDKSIIFYRKSQEIIFLETRRNPIYDEQYFASVHSVKFQVKMCPEVRKYG